MMALVCESRAADGCEPQCAGYSSAGVMMHGEDDSELLVTDLEYADDAALCASSPQQLQDGPDQ